MARITIVYWRDIPAQVIGGSGRRAEKAVLPERFEQAIDRAAMKSGARGTDAYLAEWRRGAPAEHPGTEAEAVAAEVARLDREYDDGRLKALVGNEGRAEAR